VKQNNGAKLHPEIILLNERSMKRNSFSAFFHFVQS
jgi:hypothetical protein